MKKILFYIVIAVCPLILFNGCEEDSKSSGDADYSNSSENGYEFSHISNTTGHGDPMHPQAGDVRQISTDDGWEVVATVNTRCLIQRPSCSGFNEGSPDEIGGTIEFYYYESEIDYSLNPKEVRPHLIKNYRPECINPVDPPEPCDDCDDDPCNDCD